MAKRRFRIAEPDHQAHTGRQAAELTDIRAKKAKWRASNHVDPRHHCHAIGCGVGVQPKMLMCLKHWRMVPPVLQKQVWAHYRPGQEIDKRPSREYIEVMRQAIAAVYNFENNILGRAEHNVRMPFGPYKDQIIDDLPTKQLAWIVNTLDPDRYPLIVKAAETELAERPDRNNPWVDDDVDDPEDEMGQFDYERER